MSRLRRTARRAAVVATALVAAGAALSAAGASDRPVGPLEARIGLVPSRSGGVVVGVPPLGRLDLDTHAGPLQVRATVTGVDLARARALLTGDDPGHRIAVQVQDDVQHALGLAVARAMLLALLASGLVCAAVFRRRRDVLVGTGAVTAALLVAGGTGGATYRSEALSQPRFSGLLAQAPALVGEVRDFDSYGQRVATLTANVTRVYASLSTLPDALPEPDSTRVLWVSDTHLNPTAYRVMQELVDQFDVSAVVDTGDSADLGSVLENRLVAPMGDFDVPYLWVRGNHDSRAVTQRYLAGLGVQVVDDGQVVEVAGIRFTGTGDPRFTPDKSVVRTREQDRVELEAAGDRLRRAVDRQTEPVDVALVHEPPMGEPLYGAVPLVLSGHTHERSDRVEDGTLHLVQGSSGGAGLRAFDRGEALPLQMSVLHFDDEGALLAVDDISVGGVGQRSVTLERRTPESYGDVDEQAEVD